MKRNPSCFSSNDQPGPAGTVRDGVGGQGSMKLMGRVGESERIKRGHNALPVERRVPHSRGPRSHVLAQPGLSFGPQGFAILFTKLFTAPSPNSAQRDEALICLENIGRSGRI